MSTFLGGQPLSVLTLPAASGSFTVPTPPAASEPASSLLAPNFTAGPTGKDQYRPWIGVEVDGLPFFANGFDQPWYWDGGSNFYDMGSTTPTTFAVADSATGSTHASGTTFRYYGTFYNSTLGKQTAPQVLDHTMVGTKDVDVTWTDPGGEFDKVRIFRRLQDADGFKLVATVDASDETYTDGSTDATLETADDYVRRYRTTKPPIFVGLAEHAGRLFGWKADESKLYYSQAVRIDDEFVLDDFPSANVLMVAPQDGYGGITAVTTKFATMYVWKRRGVYEVTGDSPATFTVREMFGDRGCVGPRARITIESMDVFLDERGLFLWTPGAEPAIAGAAVGTRESPLQPVWERLNLDAAHLFHVSHDEEHGLVRFHVALDYDPIPMHAVVYDYRLNVFRSVDSQPSMASGWLDDAGGKQHLTRLDDLGYLWEDAVSNTEGVSAGDLTATVSAGDELSLTCSGASFSNDDLTGVPGVPFDRYDTNGDVVDENRVYAGGSESLTVLYYDGTAPAATDSVAVGVIPAVFETGAWNFGSDAKKHVKRVLVEHDAETGTLRLDTTPDQGTWTNNRELDLSMKTRDIVPVNTRGWRFGLRGTMRYSGMDFHVSAVTVQMRLVDTRE